MLLTVRVVNGKKLVLEENTYFPEELNGEPIFKIEYSVSTNYADISTPQNWDRYGFSVANDYGVVFKEIKDLLTPIAWSGRSSTQKQLSYKYYCIGEENISLAITDLISDGMPLSEAQDFITKSWHKHHLKFAKACSQRWDYVKLTVPKYITLKDGEDLLADNVFTSLVNSYTTSGQMGIGWGDEKEGILNFIYSDNKFNGAGLEEKGYAINTPYTWGDFKDAIRDILFYGIYDKYKN